MNKQRRRLSGSHSPRFESLERRDLLTVQFRLALTDQLGNPTAEVEVGDTFQLEVFVQDQRGPAAAGVFSPYLDVTYDSGLASIAGGLQFPGEYTNAQSGDTSQPGLIDEAGAFGSFSGVNQSISLGGDSGGEFLVWRAPLVATAPGVIQFSGNAADVSPHHDLFFYDQPTVVAAQDVDYGQATLNIVPPARSIVDDGASGFSAHGSWVGYTGIGHQNDVRFNARGDGSDVATWSLPTFPGQYRVSTTWSPHANRATNAPYQVFANGSMLDEIRLNQEVHPNDFVFEGSHWEVLGIYDVGNAPLSVELSDDADEFVIADAILIERIGDATSAPIMQVMHDGTRVEHGGTVDFGAHQINDTAAETLTITNNGTANLTLDPLQASDLPSGFNLASGFGSATLQPGESTTFTIRLSTGDPINAAGSLTINSNAGSLQLQLQGVVTGNEPTPGAPEIQSIDDGDPGFTTRNQWTRYAGIGVAGDVRFSAPGSGNDRATWNFSVDPGGTYRVSTTWTPHPNRATNAPYEVRTANQSLDDVAVNQRLAPNDLQAEGTWWEDLGVYEVNDGTLVVELTDAGNGYVIADSVRIERTDGSGQPPAPNPTQVIDNGDAGYQRTGSWQHYGGIGHLRDVAFSAAGSGNDVASWTFTVTPGEYRVATTWAAHPNRATNAPYRLRDGSNPLTSVSVNQRVAPSGFSDQGSMWDELATVTVNGTTLVVELTDAANGFVIADAIRIERLS